MGSVFKKVVTRPLPANVTITIVKGVRMARWQDSKGKTRTAPVTDGSPPRIRDESGTYIAKYRDGEGIITEVSTGCRDKRAAQNKLAELERKADRVRGGMLTPAEARTEKHVDGLISDHFNAYLVALESRRVCPLHRAHVRAYLNRLAHDCAFRRLSDLTREALEGWLSVQTRNGRSARSCNTHRSALVAFSNWCADRTVGRLPSNPFHGVPKADEKADRRRQRRSMTEPELVVLLEVARRRPLQEALTVRKGSRRGEQYAQVSPTVQAHRELLGRERALIYKTLVLTGLRKNELATLTVARLRLDTPIPYVDLDPADEKTREGNQVVIRDDLAEDLRAWLAEKHRAMRSQAQLAEGHRFGAPINTGLPGDTLVFRVPTGIDKIFNRDLKAAGIAKRDDRGRTLDVHALRTTFGTLLGRGGVPLRTTQAAMRHSDPSLTANVYTDPRLLDVGGALEALPRLSLAPAPEESKKKHA